MRLLAGIAVLFIVGLAVFMVTRPSHHCFSGPMDAAALKHHPTYRCKLPQ